MGSHVIITFLAEGGLHYRIAPRFSLRVLSSRDRTTCASSLNLPTWSTSGTLLAPLSRCSGQCSVHRLDVAYRILVFLAVRTWNYATFYVPSSPEVTRPVSGPPQAFTIIWFCGETASRAVSVTSGFRVQPHAGLTPCMEAFQENFTNFLRGDVACGSAEADRKPCLPWQLERSAPSWFLFIRTQCEWRLSKLPARRLHLVSSQTLAFGVRRETLLVASFFAAAHCIMDISASFVSAWLCLTLSTSSG